MPKFKNNTNAFSIAHYILLFLVVGLCIGLVSWTLVRRNNNAPSNNVAPTITHIYANDPCAQRIANLVAQMWAYDSANVPDKYWRIADDYINQPMETKIYGVCNDVAFTCRVGQLRRECDPCAVPSARMLAQDQQTADMIKIYCADAN